MTEVRPNANFHSLGGISVHDGKSEEYMEYRRCWTEYPSNFILRDFPMHLDIEITNHCNLRCTFCDRQPFVKKDKTGNMELSLFKKIIDEGSDHKLWGVKLSYRGEPLLHKDVIEMISYAKSKGVMDMYFNTNGMLLREETSKKIIDAGLDRISISVEGTDPDLYESMRINAKFDTVLKNVTTLKKLRKKMKVSHPKIRVQSVNYPGFDVEEYRKFWMDHCDEVAMLDFTDMSKRETGIVRDWACPQLWQRMTIEWDGTVFPCNNDDLRLMSPGNVKDKTVRECWHDEMINKVRRLHKRGCSDGVKDCDGCPWRTAQIIKKERSSEEI